MLNEKLLPYTFERDPDNEEDGFFTVGLMSSRRYYYEVKVPVGGVEQEAFPILAEVLHDLGYRNVYTYRVGSLDSSLMDNLPMPSLDY